MKQLDKVLKHFNNDLTEWVSFLNEKINDGVEISRGMSPNDKSKQEKTDEAAEGDAAAQTTAPIIDPSQAPGSQISIGKKRIKDENEGNSTRVELSYQPNIIELEPKINTTEYGTP